NKIVPFYRKTWIRIAVAAVLIVGAVSTYKLLDGGDRNPEITKTRQVRASQVTSKAVLMLADGSAIALDSLPVGIVAKEGTVDISQNVKGELAYKSSPAEPGKLIYNTLKTSRGGKYKVMLDDGSQVWLNAASSLTFPAAFAGNERKVELVGEAYFEIAKDPSRPFSVSVAGKSEVQVLGTHFNITAYDDEKIIKTTLLEGSLKVSALKTRETKLLTPGQQAQVTSNGRVDLNDKANVDEVLAWKNGSFHFDNASVEQVMRQLARWYDVDVVYKSKVPARKFTGEIQHDLSLAQVLKLLERNNVFCTLNGNVITVK
ncbi:MAG: DUF4974 domain-containing protein, partial [Chitinophagaceae bacterium]